ncbi:unnamed protein product [Rhizophagus irregularis]|nr:unnamed protein product [Rhizophagus irregularis]
MIGSLEYSDMWKSQRPVFWYLNAGSLNLPDTTFQQLGSAIKHVFKNLEWLNSWTRGNLMASSLDIFRDADYSVCRILTIGSFRRELFGWLEHMENLMIQVSRCLGFGDLG